MRGAGKYKFADHCGVIPGFRLVTSYYLKSEERQVAVGASNPYFWTFNLGVRLSLAVDICLQNWKAIILF